MFLQGLLVFLAVAASDWCWVRCVCHSTAKHRWLAANWAVAQTALMNLSVIEYTHDHWMVIPSLLGAYVGTALGVKE